MLKAIFKADNSNIFVEAINVALRYVVDGLLYITVECETFNMKQKNAFSLDSSIDNVTIMKGKKKIKYQPYTIM